MRSSDALGDIVERLKSVPALDDAVRGEIHIDYPGEIAPGSPVYRPANSGAYLYFDALLKTPLGDCGNWQCRLRIYAESFAADRLEAHDLIDLAVAALDERYGAAPFAGFSPQCVAAGDVIDPLSPRSAYADFTFIL